MLSSYVIYQIKLINKLTSIEESKSSAGLFNILADGDAWLGEGAYFIHGLFTFSGLGDIFSEEDGT